MKWFVYQLGRRVSYAVTRLCQLNIVIWKTAITDKRKVFQSSRFTFQISRSFNGAVIFVKCMKNCSKLYFMSLLINGVSHLRICGVF